MVFAIRRRGSQSRPILLRVVRQDAEIHAEQCEARPSPRFTRIALNGSQEGAGLLGICNRCVVLGTALIKCATKIGRWVSFDISFGKRKPKYEACILAHSSYSFHVFPRALAFLIAVSVSDIGGNSFQRI